jgi:hypothetical protein
MAGISIVFKFRQRYGAAAPYTLDTKVFSFGCICGNTPQVAQGTIARRLEMSPLMADIIDAEESRLTRC